MNVFAPRDVGAATEGRLLVGLPRSLGAKDGFVAGHFVLTRLVVAARTRVSRRVVVDIVVLKISKLGHLTVDIK